MDSAPVPTLFVMVGLQCAGKTTLAAQIERDHAAVRFTPDEWMTSLGQDGFDEVARERIEALQLKIASRLLTLGLNVVVDFGSWGRSERDGLRAQAAAVGAHVHLRYLPITRQEQRSRLAKRNADLGPGEFFMNEGDLESGWRLFQPPDDEELTQPTDHTLPCSLPTTGDPS